MSDTPPDIDALPPPPTRGMARALFVATAKAFLAALVVFVSQMIAYRSWLISYANSYLLSLDGTSTSNLTLGLGSKTIVTQAGKGYRESRVVSIADGAGNMIVGPVTAYVPSATPGMYDLTINAVYQIGAATASAWFIGAAALTAPKVNYSHTPVVAKGNSGTATQTFVVADGEVQSVTVTGAHAWAITWPAGHSELLVIATNPGLYAITLPAGVKFILGDGSTSTTFSDMGVTLQTAGKNRFSFTSDDGGATVECAVS